MTSGASLAAVVVASLSQYEPHSLFSTVTLMLGLACWNASTAFCVSFSRESLPQVETRSAVSPSEDPPLWPLEPQAPATSRHATATRTARVRRHEDGTARARRSAACRGVVDDPGGNRCGCWFVMRVSVSSLIRCVD